MFSASVEIVLAIAYREAVSRRHAYVTLEHVLYALAHDADGERILGACGADLPKLRRDLDAYLNESIEKLARGHDRQPEQTAAFNRALQTAVLHVQSAQRQEVHAGDICAAILQQPKTQAARLLAEQGITRLDFAALRALDVQHRGLQYAAERRGLFRLVVLAARQLPGDRVLAGAIFGEVLRRFHLLTYFCGVVLLATLVVRGVLGPRPILFAVRLAIGFAMLIASAYSGLIVSAQIARAQA